jgi:hypothetical protein
MLNQQDPNNSFWKDAELINHLNEGVRLYFLEAQAVDEGQFTTQVDLDIVVDTDTVPLPADFFKVRALYKHVNDGFVLLPYRNNLTDGYVDQGGNSLNNYLPYYYFRGNSLIIRPTPNFGEIAGLRLEYIQFPDTMIWGGDAMTSQVSPIFKQLIIAYAVYKAKLKESLMNGVTVHAIAEEYVATLYKSFKDAIAIRSKGPTYVVPFNPETEGI